jgi:hypothetical protein
VTGKSHGRKSYVRVKIGISDQSLDAICEKTLKVTNNGEQPEGRSPLDSPRGQRDRVQSINGYRHGRTTTRNPKVFSGAYGGYQ